MTQFSTIHALIVEDEDAARFISERILTKLNTVCEISQVKNGQEAIEFIEQNPQVQTTTNSTCLNLILLDLNMPVMDGWEFLDAFSHLSKERQNAYKIIILSTSLHPQDRLRAENTKTVCDYLSKPLSLQSLEQAINKIS